MKRCYAYARVSTAKQGEGVSLEAQRDAITAYAQREGFEIVQWFEEKETAAKRGRPVFEGMVRDLLRRRADGLVMHKIDRGARNFSDWAKIGELQDAGINIHFATETLDFSSRGGRLTADIQAVIAADYIRNLREETIKGINGRLKQGLFPWSAPPGYLNQGGGKPKIPCPKTAPLIKLLFELYASRQYSYASLLEEMHRRGLRNTRGGRLTLCGLGNILQNPFYIGLIYVKSTGKTYEGVHEPIVPVPVWRRAQAIRENRCGPKVTRHNHLFRGLFRCKLCDRPMVPERQKGHVYYRCKGKDCAVKTIREDVLDRAIMDELKQLELGTKASAAATEDASQPDTIVTIAQQRAGLELQLSDLQARLERVEDLLIDATISKETYERKRAQVQLDIVDLRAELAELPDPEQMERHRARVAELRNSLVLLYEMANPLEKRMVIENVWPNRWVTPNGPCFEPYDWVFRSENDPALLGGALERDRGRTLIGLLDKYSGQYR
ncbi:MAG: recombinase family protein [Pseudomonadota bacterium]